MTKLETRYTLFLLSHHEKEIWTQSIMEMIFNQLYTVNIMSKKIVGYVYKNDKLYTVDSDGVKEIATLRVVPASVL